MSQIIRKQVTSNSTVTVQIDSPTTAFLVKNFTSGVVFACASTQYNENDSTMIAANTAEVVTAGYFCSSITIHAANSGTVEISRYDGRAVFSLSSMNTTQQNINTTLQGVNAKVQNMDTAFQSMESTLRNIDSTLTNLSDRLALSAGESPLSINPSDGGLDITISD